VDTPSIELVGARVDPWIVAALAGVCVATLVLGWTRWRTRGRIVLFGIGSVTLWFALVPEPRIDDAGVVDVALREGGGFVYDERTSTEVVPLGEPARLRLTSDRWRVVWFAGAIRVVSPDTTRELVVVPQRLVGSPCKGQCPGTLSCIEDRCLDVFRDLTRPFSPPTIDVALRVEADPPRGVSCRGFPPPVERPALAEYVWLGSGCASCHTYEEEPPTIEGRAPPRAAWLFEGGEVDATLSLSGCGWLKLHPRVPMEHRKLILVHLGRLHHERTGEPPQVAGASVAWLTEEELATAPRR
jgi:hypothetical protein